MIAWREPLGLCALAGLAVPLLVHLWRRTPLRVVNFPALRYLETATTPSRQRWRLRDLVLLLLRSLLVTMLALLLAMPVWRGSAAPAQPFTLRVPGIATPAAAQPASLWSLLRELDATLPAGTPLIVEAPAEVGPLDAVRPELGRVVEWRVLPGAAEFITPVHPPPAPPRLAIRYDERGRAELPVARAIAASWRARGAVADVSEAAVGTALGGDFGRVIWLADGDAADLRRFVAQGGTALVTRLPAGPTAVRLADDQGNPYLLEQRRGRGSLLILTAALTLAALPPLAAPDFPDRLEQAFERPQAAARAVGQAAAPAGLRAGSVATTSLPLDGVWVTLIVVLYASERICTLRTRPGAA